MKRWTAMAVGLAVLAGGWGILAVDAQQRGTRDEPRRDGRRFEEDRTGPERPGRADGDRDGRPLPPPGPLMAALDADRDGQLSAEEIDNASEALLALDKNDDGALSRDELPPPPPRPHHRRPPRNGEQGQDARDGDDRLPPVGGDEWDSRGEWGPEGPADRDDEGPGRGGREGGDDAGRPRGERGGPDRRGHRPAPPPWHGDARGDELGDEDDVEDPRDGEEDGWRPRPRRRQAPRRRRD